MKLTKLNIICCILLIFYSVGAVGITIDSSRETFIALTPLNLLLTLALLLLVHSPLKKSLIKSLIASFVIGFGIEVIGVKTGLLFGDYLYGAPLGAKIFDTPIMIGVNWFILSISAFGIFEKLKVSAISKAIMAAATMVVLDFIIEPVAIKLNFWNWKNNEIPIENYIMWFLVALLIQFLFQHFKPKVNRQIAFTVMILQVLFFGVLNFVL